jgi:hypothetical protein
MQEPAWQLSVWVHASPSLHVFVSSFVETQPLPGSQVSSVHELASSQASGGPPSQEPAAQVSLVVHAFPSLHGSVLGVFTQPVAGVQLSVVHGLLSSQVGGVPATHWPSSHVSLPLQRSVSGQAVPSGTKASAGQAEPAPVQKSGTSQTPAETRHTVVGG